MVKYPNRGNRKPPFQKGDLIIQLSIIEIEMSTYGSYLLVIIRDNHNKHH